jgi:hypothetical protein
MNSKNKYTAKMLFIVIVEERGSVLPPCFMAMPLPSFGKKVAD